MTLFTQSDVRQGNTYYEDIHKSAGRFDFVMANSASDARGSELEVRIAGNVGKLLEAEL